MNPYETVVSLPPERKIDHDETEVPVCPHCGFRVEEFWKFGPDFGHGDDLNCGKCNARFTIFTQRKITYKTQKV